MPHRQPKLTVVALVLIGTITFATFSPSPAVAAENDSQWIEVFSGKDFRGWTKKMGDWSVVGDVLLSTDNPKAFALESGTGVMVNGQDGPDINIISKYKHGDVEAHIEFTLPKGSNSGVYFQGRYEVQVLDSFGVEKVKYSDCGGIYQRYDEEKEFGFEGHSPRINASLPPGQWQSFDVIFRAPRFDQHGKKTEDARFVKVVHNGKVVHENVSVTGPTRSAVFQDEKPLGPLMIQGDHGPVAYRNIRIKPIQLK